MATDSPYNRKFGVRQTAENRSEDEPGMNPNIGREDDVKINDDIELICYGFLFMFRHAFCLKELKGDEEYQTVLKAYDEVMKILFGKRRK